MRNVLIFILISIFLVGCQETQKAVVKEEPKEGGGMNSRGEACLTVENFNLVKNYILENGEEIKQDDSIFRRIKFGTCEVSIKENDEDMISISSDKLTYVVINDKGTISAAFYGMTEEQEKEFKKHFCDIVVAYIKQEIETEKWQKEHNIYLTHKNFEKIRRYIIHNNSDSHHYRKFLNSGVSLGQ